MTTTKTRPWALIPHSKLDAIILINQSPLPAHDVHVLIGETPQWNGASIPAGGSVTFFPDEYAEGQPLHVRWETDGNAQQWGTHIRKHD